MSLTQEQKDIILGTLLGDGYLNERGGNVRLQMNHGLQQEEYIKWKAEKLHNLLTPRGLKRETFNDRHSRTGKVNRFNFFTISHEYLAFLRELLYIDNKKTFTEECLDRLTPLGLACWIMDDGSLDRRKSKVRKDGTRIYSSVRFRICTCSKDGIQEELICKKLKEKFNLDFTTVHHGKGYYIVNCNTTNFRKLVEIVKPFIVPSMRYKIDTDFIGTLCD